MQPNDTAEAGSTAAAPTANPTEPVSRAAPPVMWAIVELMGHARIAGAISSQVFAGTHLVLVQVPEVTVTEIDWDSANQRTEVLRNIPAHSRSFGASAIYSINWCDELTATVAAHGIRHEVIKPYSMRSALEALPEPQRQRLLALTAGATTATTTGDDDDFHF